MDFSNLIWYFIALCNFKTGSKNQSLDWQLSTEAAAPLSSMFRWQQSKDRRPMKIRWCESSVSNVHCCCHSYLLVHNLAQSVLAPAFKGVVLPYETHWHIIIDMPISHLWIPIWKPHQWLYGHFYLKYHTRACLVYILFWSDLNVNS